jgi:hypothetical protein
VIARLGDYGGAPSGRIETVRAIERENRLAAARFDLDPGDPRWLLASRTAMALEGTALPADSRDRILRLAHDLRLRPFEANMIIAIVQDEARLENSGGQIRAMSDRLKARLRIVPNRKEAGADSARVGPAMTLPVHAISAPLSEREAGRGLSVGWQAAGSILLGIALTWAIVRWILQG